MPHIGEKAQVVTEPPLSMAAQTVAVTGSPFTFTATRSGMLFIAGGTLSTIQYSRGASINTLGLGTSQLMVVPGDQVRISYLTPPQLTFLPTQ